MKIIDAVLKERPELDPREALRRSKREADIAEMMQVARDTQRLDEDKRREQARGQMSKRGK